MANIYFHASRHPFCDPTKPYPYCSKHDPDFIVEIGDHIIEDMKWKLVAAMHKIQVDLMLEMKRIING